MPIISSQYLLYNPANVTTGGYFNSGDVQSFAAFLMAIKEFNNKNDGIGDSILKNTQFKFVVRIGDVFHTHFKLALTLFERSSLLKNNLVIMH